MAQRKAQSDSLVLRNSLWIGLQPLILNIVSVFVTGYIARSLGQEDYGKFVFAFAFVALLMPVGNLGLRAVTVRDIAANREAGLLLLGRIFSLRIVLALFSMFLLVVLINVMGYPSSTKFVVYIAGTTLLTRTAATTLFDVFQAYERMQYIAISEFVSGTLLTIGSVVVLFIGYRLIGLTIVYSAAILVLFLIILAFYLKFFPLVRLHVDKAFWLESVKKGFPFFITGMLGILNIRIGVILLSRLGGDAAAGQYGASFSLVERLNVIPESLCTAIFPTIALLFASSRAHELNDLLKRYMNYLLILGLSVAVGTTLLASEIINLIYGDQYANSGPVLAVLAWNLPGFFLAMLLGYALGAIHRQGTVARFSIAATVLNVALNFVLIPLWGAVGAALAYASFGIMVSAAMFWVVHRDLNFRLGRQQLIRIVLANAVMAGCVVLLKTLGLVVAIIGGAGIYIVLLVVLRVVKRDDWHLLRAALMRRGPVDAPDPEDAT